MWFPAAFQISTTFDSNSYIAEQRQVQRWLDGVKLDLASWPTKQDKHWIRCARLTSRVAVQGASVHIHTGRRPSHGPPRGCTACSAPTSH